MGITILLSLWYVGYRMYTGSSLRSAIAGPQKLASETSQLREGEAKIYSFHLPTPRRISVSVQASPKRVNAFLMDKRDYAEFKAASGNLFGGRFHYVRALSDKMVTAFRGAAVLPAGDWVFVVRRPHESLLFGESTKVHVLLLAH